VQALRDVVRGFTQMTLTDAAGSATLPTIASGTTVSKIQALRNNVKRLFEQTLPPAGSQGTAVGNGAMGSVTTGDFNAAFGDQAGTKITTGRGNTIMGSRALEEMIAGDYNTVIGSLAAQKMATGNNNIVIGSHCIWPTTGVDNSIYIGFAATSGSTTAAPRTNEIVLGGTAGNGSNTVTLGSSTTLTTNGLRCRSTVITAPSDARLKENIEPADLDLCVAAVRALPVKRFSWRPGYGDSPDKHLTSWIAQDVEKVFPKSVTEKDEMFKVPDDNGGEVEVLLKDVKSTTMSEALPTLWGAVQRLIEKNEQLEAELVELRAAQGD
jgi:hypothetical protein